MSIYKEMRERHKAEIKCLLLDHSHLTIMEASKQLGVDQNSLRRIAHHQGVAFLKKDGGRTSVAQELLIPNEVTLAPAPWDEIRS
ncbi:MAG: hypothetical protein Unbinned4497contig1000_54 [Prokaryotic dsDNA virus sp.]|nr:MAG: hypothetical protein Unbinned4497contig1000_54 [Prokaryotic dsDNA virus sp.]|tara:strand:- start:12349 stop:12603 length:255 start_codon:yes stop_codon:yes gene_type:complete